MALIAHRILRTKSTRDSTVAVSHRAYEKLSIAVTVENKPVGSTSAKTLLTIRAFPRLLSRGPRPLQLVAFTLKVASLVTWVLLQLSGRLPCGQG